MNRALKPGGILGVVEHRGDPGKPQDPRASNGYVNEDYAIALIESAGFELVARSRDQCQPEGHQGLRAGRLDAAADYRQGSRDRAKYEAIGESDRFTLKFRKQLVAATGRGAPSHHICLRRDATSMVPESPRRFFDLHFDVRALEGLLVEALDHLFGEEAAAATVHVAIRGLRLAGDLEAQRHHAGELVARAGHRHVQQAAFFFDELGLAGGELRREAAVDDVEDVDAGPTPCPWRSGWSRSPGSPRRASGWPARSLVAFGGSSVSSVTKRSRVWYCDDSSSSWSRSPMRVCTCSYMRSMCGLYHSRTSAIWPRHSRFGSPSAVNRSR